MEELNYDAVKTNTADGTKIRYGIVYGNETVVFIKTGYDGKIRGKQNKYLKMAKRIHDRLGATIICADNPDVENNTQVAADKAMIEAIATEQKLFPYSLLLFGTSDGAYLNLLLAKQMPQTVQILGVNPSIISEDGLMELLQSLSSVKKHFVFGTEDELFYLVSLLEKAHFENLELISVEGANHEFSGRMEEYVALSDLLRSPSHISI